MTRSHRTFRMISTSTLHRVGLAVALLFGSVGLVGVALAAGPVYWDWPAGRSFDELERQGLALDQQGQLVRGLDSRQVGPSGPEVIWHLADDAVGGAYLGSGHGGQLFHISGKGDQQLMAQLDGAEIFSILPRADGSLLAGCGSEGQLYRVSPEGEAVLLGTVAGGYIWAMAEHPASGEVWLAVGSPAAVYRLDRNDKLESVRALAAQNCLTVAFAPDGHLMLGTQGPGLVYRLDPSAPEKTEVVFQAPQDEVRQFIPGPGGELFVLTLDSADEKNGNDSSRGNGKNGDAPSSLMSLFAVEQSPSVDRSALYRLESDGTMAPYWSANLDLMIAAWSETWGWLAGGPLDEEAGYAELHSLAAPAGHHPLVNWEGGDILDILVQPVHGGPDRVLVAQAHPGAVWEVGRFGKDDPVATSPPLDGRQNVTWGRLRWDGGHKPEGVKFSVRGGNRDEPDATWTDWSGWWTEADHEIDLAPCRYLQWRVKLPGDVPADQTGPVVAGVSVSAWQDNIRPVVRDLVLESISDISLGGMMNGGDNVTQSFRSGLKAEFSRNSRADRRAEGSRAAVTRPMRVFTWQGQDPNGDRLVYRLEYSSQGQGSWREIIKGTEENIGSWDTSEVPDGSYQVRLTASDERDNPAGLALSASTETGPIVVDNTAPVIKGFALKPQAGGFQVLFEAEDKGSSLAWAEIQLPDGSRQRLDPVDRICDSRREKFAAAVAWPQPGKAAGSRPWVVRVEIRDLAGNQAVAEGALAAEGR
jgi:hypothetical protein